MLVRVDPESPRGLAEQIADQLRAAIARGELPEGARLPPARELAAGLDVNVHTVLRAYAELREEAVIDVRRGRGAHVVSGAGDTLRNQLARRVTDLVAQAQLLGVDRDELIDQIREATP